MAGEHLAAPSAIAGAEAQKLIARRFVKFLRIQKNLVDILFGVR
jgi:hypothetical protein